MILADGEVVVQQDDRKERLLKSTDKKEIEEIINLFNMDIVKKNAIRTSVYSDMIDRIIDEMGARIEKYPGQFSNKDLLDYLTAMQNSLTKTQVDSSSVPLIAVQNNNIINFNPLSGFDRESKDRMRDVLKSILDDDFVIKTDEIEEVSEVVDTNGIGEEN